MRLSCGMTQEALAKACHTTNPHISRLEAGQRVLSVPWLTRLARALECRPVDLLPLEIVFPELSKQVDGPIEEAPFEYRKPVSTDIRPWPVPSREGSFWFCPNGCAYFGQEFLDRFDIEPRHCEVVQVRNSSMAPTLVNGSACMIYKRLNLLEEDELFAVEQDGELLIRWLQRYGSSWCLVANAENVPTICLNSTTAIIGRVVWACRMVGSRHFERRAMSVGNPVAAE